MERRHVLAAALILIMLAAAVVPASAAVEPEGDNYWIEFSGGTLNPCTDEWVELRGYLHFVYTLVEHENGAGTVQGHMNGHATGVGESSGMPYQAIVAANDHTRWDFDYAPDTYTSVIRSRVVTPGAKNNDVFWQRLHTTINANGTLTVDIDEFGFECK